MTVVALRPYYSIYIRDSRDLLSESYRVLSTVTVCVDLQTRNPNCNPIPERIMPLMGLCVLVLRSTDSDAEV